MCGNANIDDAPPRRQDVRIELVYRQRKAQENATKRADVSNSRDQAFIWALRPSRHPLSTLVNAAVHSR